MYEMNNCRSTVFFLSLSRTDP